MTKDLVIDTNILVYLENKDYQYHERCIKFEEEFSESNFFMCFDEGFHFEESKNKSFIWYEYRKHLPIGSKGYTLILKLIQQGRLKFIPTKIDMRIRKIIIQSGIKDSDKYFVKITFNSKSKILITDEHEDFTIQKRKEFKKALKIHIIHSWELPPDLFEEKRIA